MWPVPYLKAAPADTVARNLVASVFRDLGPSLGCPTRARLGPQHALRRRLPDGPARGSTHHHNGTRKAECVNGVVDDVLRSFAGERADDWPTLVPLAEFAINDSVSPLGTG